MFRRRRRPAGVWLPPDPYNRVGQDAGPITGPYDSAVGSINFRTLNQGGAVRSAEVPLVGDDNNFIVAGENTLSGNAGTLADIVKQGYRLRRICGSLFVAVEQLDHGDGAPNQFFVTAGIIVRRVNSAGVAVTDDTDPQDYASQRDPWVWRRSWALSNNANVGGTVDFSYFDFPHNNTEFGSVREGAFIDQKTKRVVAAEERLFLDISCLSINGDGVALSTPLFLALWDLRFFAFMMNSSGNRRNASR